MARKSVLFKKDIEQKLQEDLDQENKVLIKNPRKLILGVANPMLSAELAYHIARYTNMNVCLIDADVLKPTVHLHLGMKETVNEKVITNFETKSAFNMIIDYISVNSKIMPEIFRNIAIKHPNNRNLHVFTGNDDIELVEDYNQSAFEVLLEKSIDVFDLVIVNVPNHIYDNFFKTTARNANYMLFGFGAYADDIMMHNKVIRLLDKYNINKLEQNIYVPFDYASNRQMSLSDIKRVIVGDYVGHVSGDRKRQMYRNEFGKGYSSNMSSKNINDYHRLARAFGYKTRSSKFFGRRVK